MSDLLRDGGDALKSRDIVEMLRRHYLPEGRPAAGVLAVEIGAPDSQRRADALWAPLTVSGGGLVGHEIKVSRSDVIVELQDATKADAWAKYCTRWWLTVSDPALVAGLDIPEHWGVMAPPSGRRTRSMTIVKEAPKLKVANDAPAWRRVFAWAEFRHQDALRGAAYDARLAEAEQKELKDRIRALEIDGIAKTDPRARLVRDVIAAIDTKQHDTPRLLRYGLREIDANVIADAILDTTSTRDLTARAQQDLKYLIDSVDRAITPMKHVREDLAALVKRGQP